MVDGMTDFSVRLLINSDFPAVAHGDTSQTYVDLVRVWMVALGEPITVQVHNNDTGPQTFTMFADVVRIS